MIGAVRINPVDTRRRFNVYTTSLTSYRRRIDVETTSYVYWEEAPTGTRMRFYGSLISKSVRLILRIEIINLVRTQNFRKN